ncbi:MAG TPA: hypothetical protein VNA89_13625 [Gemmatimonadaceae bacterium]|nr:hypothetical protein [Gemmatimonadaceae bacterium]
MSTRSFRDAHGVEWRVYAMMPKGLERRRNDRRRGSAQGYSGPERRAGGDRRLDRANGAAARNHGFILPGLEGGWLVFDAPAERRRITPIPGDWERATDAELEALCRGATVVTTRRSSMQPPSFEE